MLIFIPLVHRCFMRFSIEGTAYQFTVMPFGLALSLRTFMKCVDATLSCLRAHLELFGQLADIGAFGRCAQQPQTRSVASSGELRSLREHTEECVVPQPVDHVSGCVLRLGSR